ncbi:sigma 54-interacting transcriptional regulator [Candidatus Poribacteria bacterium]|nr:sigma 54-interacting transcriptional regulator [Candidatus Poribacteria bacterium]
MSFSTVGSINWDAFFAHIRFSDEHGSLVWKAINGDFEDGIFAIDGGLNLWYTDVPFHAITGSHHITMTTNTKERPSTKRSIDAQMRPPKHGTWQTYDVTDGLPAGVACLLQDRHGYLWLGTEVGLCRYDGAEFTTYTSADGLADDHITSICEDRQGRLWLGTGAWNLPGAKGVSCFNGQHFITYTTADGLAHNNVVAICSDRQGRLWFGTWGGGISCFDGEHFTTYTAADGLADNHVTAIYSDRQGRLWVGTGGWVIPGKGVSCFDGHHFTTYTTTDGLGGNDVGSICEDHQGRLWFAFGWVSGGGVSCFDGEHFTTYTTADGLAYNDIVAIREDRQGRLWFAFGWPDDDGVACFDGGHFTTYTTEDGLLDNRVTDITQDQEGHFWFAHLWSGLTRFEPETLQFLTSEPVTETLLQDRRGRLWFGSGKNLCCLLEGQQYRQSFNAQVRCLLEDSRGNFWVGTVGDGLYGYDFDTLNPADSADVVWDSAGRAQQHLLIPQSIEVQQEERSFATEEGSGSGNVQFLLEGRDGTIWVGTAYPGYLCRYNEEGFEAIPTPQRAIFRLLEDSQGRIWMGGWAGGGLSCAVHPERCRRDGKQLITYTMADGLPADHVGSIVEDDAGHLWIGTQRGLCRFDGNQFTTYGKAEGLTSLFHQCATKDATGQLWFGTLRGGLYRYDGVHFQWLTTDDGLPSNSITCLVPQPDGSMIIGTYRGIVHYRPTATLPPRIEITAVVADQVYRNPTSIEIVAVGAQHAALQISYRSLSFATRRMRYSYILEGYDTEWQDTWENHVRYENLPAGKYTFKVIAINRDLVPSEAPATLKLTIQPDPRIVALQTEVAHLRREVGRKYHFENLIGRSAAIKQVRTLMEKAIDSGLTVLITGETGTGKELVAKAIHHNSHRKDKPMLELNCGAVPKDLIASTLFGHRKGAFTGAHENKMGLFEAASGGTVLLDEIGEMSHEGQVHLLRLLEERQLQRLGEYKTRDVDVRVIAMTNRDPQKDVAAGRFREDVYYRLNEFPIHVPPLRKRLEDIPLLAAHFLKENHKEVDSFAPDVFEMLQSYPWPGNVRELRNVIRRAAALVEEGMRIQTYHFPAQITRGESLIQEILSEQAGILAAVERLQRRLIEDALRECGGNHTQAAKRLGVHRPSLIRLMKRLGIESGEA